MTKGITSKILDWVYAKALTGISGTESAYSLARNYMNTPGSLEQKVDRLIKWQVTKSATSGFITGFGGLMMMPFSIPANIASVIFIQIRMIAAIAHMGGHDIQSDRVKSMIYICMAGNGAKELAKEASVKAGEKALINISQKATGKITESISSKGLTKITKAIPIMGGIIGASFDAITTKITGDIAKKTFINNNNINVYAKSDSINL